VGLTVGLSVGSTVGFRVGISVGVRVGFRVGISVGREVGVSVGDTVSPGCINVPTTLDTTEKNKIPKNLIVVAVDDFD